jgi:hypothetical protein
MVITHEQWVFKKNLSWGSLALIWGVETGRSPLEERALRRGVVGRRGTAVGSASGDGGRQLAVRGDRTRRYGHRSVVDSAEERLEWAIHGGMHRAGRSYSEGPEGLSGLELEGL